MPGGRKRHFLLLRSLRIQNTEAKRLGRVLRVFWRILLIIVSNATYGG
jgi:hypothetical protein